jgi:hypothetical protein
MEMEAEGEDIEKLDGTYHPSVVARKNLRTGSWEIGSGRNGAEADPSACPYTRGGEAAGEECCKG